MKESKGKISAIVQARISSERLPRKVILPLAGKPVLWHVLNRLQHCKKLDSIILATSTKKEDRELKDISDSLNIPTFFGNPTDVLSRYYYAAKEYLIDNIVRITADCPVIDPVIVDEVIEGFIKDEYDCYGLSGAFPDGLDTSVFTFRSLETAFKEAKLSSDREHVAAGFFKKNRHRFRIGGYEKFKDKANYRWTLDEPEDYEFLKIVFDELYKEAEVFTYQDIFALLERRPELTKINSYIIRNEGYLKSLKEDERNPRIYKSNALWERAIKVIPSGTQTLSKGPDQFVKGVAPIYLQKGKGCYVWDVDGNKYIDYPMALGPIILGYGYPAVVEAIKKQLRDGTAFTLMHPLEVELAELLCEMVPCAEMVRFAKNGVDATSAAVRVARAYTGREKIAYCGYHGYQDWYAIATSRNKGIPKCLKDYIFEFKYNNLESLGEIFNSHPEEIACVIMEQPDEEPKDNFLQRVIDLAHKNNAIFIFDEIVTGFRYALGGAQEYYHIMPDLACFGKGMANGMPISCVVGKREIMEEFDEVFFSTTFGGETLSLAAAVATINEIKKRNVIPYLWKQGIRFKNKFNKLAKEIGVNSEIIGPGPRTHFIFKDKDSNDSLEMKSLFLQETVKREILFGGPIFMTYLHADKDIDKTLGACEAALKILKKAIEDDNIGKYMEGEKIGEVFRERI